MPFKAQPGHFFKSCIYGKSMKSGPSEVFWKCIVTCNIHPNCDLPFLKFQKSMLISPGLLCAWRNSELRRSSIQAAGEFFRTSFSSTRSLKVMDRLNEGCISAAPGHKHGSRSETLESHNIVFRSEGSRSHQKRWRGQREEKKRRGGGRRSSLPQSLEP